MDKEFDVVVVGGGPVGLWLACELALAAAGSAAAPPSAKLSFPTMTVVALAPGANEALCISSVLVRPESYLAHVRLAAEVRGVR
jgi:glycine/D-amino acid oxidase-like deaminating enzyme